MMQPLVARHEHPPEPNFTNLLVSLLLLSFKDNVHRAQNPAYL